MMKSTSKIFLIVSFLLISFGFASNSLLKKSIAEGDKNFEGTWTGYLTQEHSGLAHKYHFKMQIKQEGKKIKGFSTITMLNDEEIYGMMNFNGEVDKSRAGFKEEKIIKQNMYSNAYWCIKYGELHYKIVNKVQVLEGHWEGCGSSSPKDIIHLEKIIL